MIPGRAILALSASQLISWGVTYFLIGGFGDSIGADLGWTLEIVHGGFSIALLIMGLASPLCGRLIDRYGGPAMMSVGAVLNAAGCAGLAVAHGIPAYYAAWSLLGIGMRLTLYDAAFAALARIGGPEARSAMAQITLLGGLASTVFWPLGHMIAERVGWRGALLAYAGFALLTIPLNLTLPRERHGDRPQANKVAPTAPLAVLPRERMIAGVLYAVIATLANVLNAAMSAHMIGILSGLGVAASVAVWVATTRGIGQGLSRLSEVLFGRHLHPIAQTIAAASLLPLCFAAGLFSGTVLAAAFAFAFVYGAGNGVLTITRGTLPLVLFDTRTYGAYVGRLLVPSFLLSAASPVVYAVIIERFGEAAALSLSAVLGLITVAAAIALKLMFGGRR